MPSGYLVTLGDGTLDSGDAIGGPYTSFTTDQFIGSGNWVWTGTWSGWNYTNEQEPGGYYLATDGNIYFVPDYGSVSSISNASVQSAPTYPLNDGFVTGTSDDDLIDDSYVDDDGDQIDTTADNADSILAGAGDDTILSGAGNDTVEAGSDSDTVDGGAGDDLIYGDSATPITGTPTSEILHWADQGADGANIAAGFTQTTGEMDVSVSFANTGNNNPLFRVETSDTNYVAGGETFDTQSSAYLYGNGDDQTSTTTISFAATDGSVMQDEVENVSFRINDIDWGNNNHTDVVTVNAYDADGNAVRVAITPSGADTVVDNTITASASGESQADAAGSALIEVAGPVASIEIIYGNAQSGTQAIWVTDVHFDTIVQTAGDDSLSGGEGSDTLFGQDGDDTLAGGADGDSLSGGAGMDFLDYSASDAAVDIDLEAGTASGGHATGDTIAGGLDGIIGSDFNDTLTGYDGSGVDWTNVFFGGDGDDLMDGAGGGDSLYGEAGNDTLIGGTGADLLDGGADDDTLYAGAGDTVLGGAGDDVFVIDDTALGGGTISIDGGETDEPGGDTLNLNGTAGWDATITYTNTDPNALAGSVTLTDGTVVNFSNIEDLVICFTGGTHILTPYGARKVEDLCPGDLVITRDHGVQPIRWIGSKTVAGRGNLAPIRFAPGTLGNDRPLLVSPQHRMLHQSATANLYFNHSEVLIPAKHMVNGSTIEQVTSTEITYFHLLFDDHEILFAEGVPSESFHPGQLGLSAVDTAAREELFSLFPDLRTNANSYGDAARLCLKAHEARLLAA